MDKKVGDNPTIKVLLLHGGQERPMNILNVLIHSSQKKALNIITMIN